MTDHEWSTPLLLHSLPPHLLRKFPRVCGERPRQFDRDGTQDPCRPTPPAAMPSMRLERHHVGDGAVVPAQHDPQQPRHTVHTCPAWPSLLCNGDDILIGNLGP